MSLLSKPHPFIFNRASVMVPGILTFLLIAIIAPFEFQELSLEVRLFFAIMIGAVCSLSVVLTTEFFKRGFPSFVNGEDWTIGKEILLFLAVISVICLNIFLIFLAFDFSSSPPGELFTAVVFNTLAISIFPIITLVLFEQYNHKKKQLIKATEMNSSLSFEPKKTNERIQLAGENGKIELQLVPEELIFLKSDGNYVEVYHGLGQPEKKLIRNRLKFLAEQLPDHLFFHCHKSYVVNKLSVVMVHGNARNFELKLRDVSERIPVSRAKSEELNRFLKS